MTKASLKGISQSSAKPRGPRPISLLIFSLYKGLRVNISFTHSKLCSVPLCIMDVHNASDSLKILSVNQYHRKELTKEDLTVLLSKAARMYSMPGYERPQFMPCKWMHRLKPEDYYDTILRNESGIMYPYLKTDRSGDPRSCITGNLSGLFFSVCVDVKTGEPKGSLVYGNCRLLLPCAEYMRKSNLYFADVYCTVRSDHHYVTLVMTTPGSIADEFCQEKLIPLNKHENPFLYVDDSGAHVTTRIFLEVMYTEKVDIRGYDLQRLTDTSYDQRRSYNLHKNPNCTDCNLD